VTRARHGLTLYTYFGYQENPNSVSYFAEDDHHFNRTVNMRPRIERQGEWMSANMMKPQRPTSPETNDVPLGIYGTGFWEPVFEDSLQTKWQRLEEYAKTLDRIVDNVKEGREYSAGIPPAGPPVPEEPEYKSFDR
jgi:hypothetical protein